jgi:AT-rich interactive domain-containing protein 4B
MEKVQEIRKIYMDLKSEVALIDRRRKRAKRKERESKLSENIDCL